jgi:hypothetical protein
MEYLTEECNNDVDVLCQMVRKKRSFVEGRLNLLVGHPRVLAALEHNVIPMGVAQQLNQVHDEGHLLLLLDQAIQQGATVRTVSQWVREANVSEPVQLPPLAPATDTDGATAPASIFERQCWFCKKTKHAHTLRMYWLHEYCEDFVRDALRMPSTEDEAAVLA